MNHKFKITIDVHYTDLRFIVWPSCADRKFCLVNNNRAGLE